MLRSVTKTCFAYAYSGADAVRRLFPRFQTQRTAVPFIVCYHRVVEKFDHSARYAIPPMLISTSMLERHIDWIGKRFSLVSLDEMTSHLESPRQFRKPPAAITFDDGYSDVYYNALPLLKRKGVPCAVFAVTGLIGTDRPQIFDRLYLSLRDLELRGLPVARTILGVSRSMTIDTPVLDRLRQCSDDAFRIMSVLLNTVSRDQVERIVSALESGVRYSRDVFEEMKPLSWDMAGSLVRNGMTLGSHTTSHALLTTETLDAARRELHGSKQTLEVKLKRPIYHFAYPDGRFNAAVVQAVNAAGYRYAYGICRKRDPQFPMLTIPRKVLWERSCLDPLGRFSPAVMNCQTRWAFDAKQYCEHDHVSTLEAAIYGSIA